MRVAAEGALGHDFAHVRVHADARAAASAAALDARAYTFENHIVFAAGTYRPEVPEGRTLLLHELTHVRQSRFAHGAEPRRLTDPNSRLERDAVRSAAQRAPQAPARADAGVVLRTPAAGKTTAPTAAQRAERARAQREHARAEREQREHAALIDAIAHAETTGGLVVAVYGSHVHGAGAQAEFKRQAEQFAADHRAIGVASGKAKVGAAMELTKDLSALLADLATAVSEVVGASVAIPIRSLAIFTHGIETQLEAAPPQSGQKERVQWISDVQKWVATIAPYMAPAPQILLYACRTAGQPAKGVPFAEGLATEMQLALQQRYGAGAAVGPQVWGHRQAAHTTANPRLVAFGGGPASVARDLLAELGAVMVSRAVAVAARSRHLPALTPEQLRTLEDDGALACEKRVLRTTPAEQAQDAPKNVYVREIPQMGMDRVLRDFSRSMTPDFSDLDLTPDAVRRVAEGFRLVQALFDAEVAVLAQRASVMGAGDFTLPRAGRAAPA